MTSKKNAKRTRKTSIVPRVVFQTLVAVSVVPAATVLAGCGQAVAPSDSGIGPAADSGTFSVAMPPPDGGRDMGTTFSVAIPLDAGHDAAFFGVAADGGPPSRDAGQDTGFFSVVAFPLDGEFSVLVAPFDANTNT